jgi:GntR family transcriptional regulator, histidine utilization repressor
MSRQAAHKLISDTTPRPLYLQVKNYIETQIRSGAWPPESKIPSENELVVSLGVSRMTVNRALRELSTDGYLIRLQGVGTYVAAPKPQSALLEIRSIAHEIESRGGVHSSRVHVLQSEMATADLASAMQISTGAEVFHAVLIHMDTGVPVQLADRFVNPAIAPGFLEQDFSRTTPNQYLISVAPIAEVEHIIEAVMPSRRVQALLEISAKEPCLLLHRKTWVDTTVATVSRFFYRGSRFRIGGRFKPASDVHRMIT